MKGFVLLGSLVAIGAGVYAAVNKLEPAALQAAITFGLGLGVAIPLTVAMLLLWRSTPGGGEREAMPAPPAWPDPYGGGYPQPNMTQPRVMVIPPVMMGQPTRGQMQATWQQAPGERRYTVIGEGDDAA